MNRLIIAVPLLIGLSSSAFLIPIGTSPIELDARERSIHNRIMKYGYPGTAELKYLDGYVLSYDGRNRCAHWVAERLNAESLAGDAKQAGQSFRQDSSVPQEHRSRASDYAASGFEKGHMAAAANHPASHESIRDTMIYSNASPQVGKDFNKGIWKFLEINTRAFAGAVDDLYVFTGPIYRHRADEMERDENGKRFVRHEVIGDSIVSVPTHFFKVMLAEVDNRIAVQAFILPNKASTIDKEDIDWADYLVSVDEVERRTGLDFFNVLTETVQRRLEKSVPADPWDLIEED